MAIPMAMPEPRRSATRNSFKRQEASLPGTTSMATTSRTLDFRDQAQTG
jgi:hypothetical protein